MTGDAVLPRWEPGTPGVLAVEGPHAIPVSTAVRGGDRRIVFALGHSRGTLARLRDHPYAAFALMGVGVAFTAVGDVSVVREELDAAPSVAALALGVAELHDHLADGRTEMLASARYRRPDPDIAAADAAILAELRALAGA